MAGHSLEVLQRLAREVLQRPDLVEIVLEAESPSMAAKNAERVGVCGREKVSVTALAQIRRDFGRRMFYRMLEETGATPR